MRVARCLARLMTGALLLTILIQCAPAPPSEHETLAQTAPKPKDEDGIGSTGRSIERPKPLDDEGIGGTGATSEAPKPFEDDGIGGTGIIGVITGFGSVIVNGHHVEFDQSTPIGDAVGPIDPAALRVGHVVEIAAANRDGTLTARGIFRRHPVAGPIESKDGKNLLVLGQSIAIVPATRFGPGLSDLTTGYSVTVSGFRRADGVVVATRIDKRNPSAPGILTAPVAAIDSKQIRIGSQRIDRGDVTGVSSAKPGSIVTVTGRIVDGRMVEAAGRVQPRLPFAGRLQRLSVQGFASRGSGGGLQLQDMEIEGGESAASESALITVEGRFAGGVLNATKFSIDALNTPPQIQLPLNQVPRTLPRYLKTLPDRIQDLDAGRIPFPNAQRPQLPPAALQRNPDLPAAILRQPPNLPPTALQQLPSAVVQQLPNLPPAVLQQLPNLPPSVLQQLPNLPPDILQQLPNLPPEILQQLPNLPPDVLQQRLQQLPASQ